MKIKMTKDQVHEIETFLAGSGGAWDWDDFISIRLDDPELERYSRILR